MNLYIKTTNTKTFTMLELRSQAKYVRCLRRTFFAEIVSQILKLTITKLLSEIDTVCKLKDTLLFKEILLNLQAIQRNWEKRRTNALINCYTQIWHYSKPNKFSHSRQTIRTHVIELQIILTKVFLT